ncbi:MAG: PH domain-containing protein [Candidatus Thermoplasmatota archaeon]|nr:PH domain-containing protein [Candidatus Thermoplasmatota archaeon]
MASGLSDRLLWRGAPSRLIFLHFYLLVILLAGVSLSISWELFNPGLPMMGGYDLNVILGLTAALLAFFTFLAAELKRITRRYMVLEHRVARREGILSKRVQYMPYNKVERVEIRQSILARLFGIGNLYVDTGEDSLTFQAVRNPVKVERIVAKQLKELRVSAEMA